jgi:hypothetical protein
MNPMHPLPFDTRRTNRMQRMRPATRLPASLRLGVLALVSALGLLGSGCGPGVGGTGTGASEGSLDYFGAQSTLLCESDLALLLLCPGSAGAPAPTPGAASGTLVRYFADSTTAPRMHLRVEGQRGELEAPCARLQFSGEWGQVPGRGGRFYGGAVLASTPLPASLTATRAGTGMVVELRDGDERTLQAPVQLVPVAAPQVVSCP